MLTCSFATLPFYERHIFHAFNPIDLTELWSCLSGQTSVKLRPRMKLASGCRPTQLYGRIGCPTRPNASRNLAFTIAPRTALGWIFVMVLDDNFCQQKRARNLLFLRRCKNILTYIEEGVETWDLWGSRAINDGILNQGVWCRNKSWSESAVFHLDGLAQSPPK